VVGREGAVTGRAGGWTDAELDHWRTVADEPADRAVAGYFAVVDGAAPATLMRSLVEHLHVPPEDQVPAISAFLAAETALPDWADRARMARGQSYFSDWAVHQFTALYLASLPSAYAAAKGVHVLWLTARLQDDPERRLNETAQFLMDVTAPGSFDAGGPAVGRVLHVRLMHAAIRWLIDHDPRVERPAAADPGAVTDRPTWAMSWGRPLNQEDLAGTMLTFTTVVFEAFRRSGLDVSGAEDSLHLWLVIAHLLGVVDELLPADLAAADELQRMIFGRQHAPSVVGADLTATLLGLVDDRLPGRVAGLAPAMLRRYIGDDVADMIAVPRVRWAGPLLDALVLMTRITTFGRRVDPVPRWVSARVGRWFLDGLLSAGRHGQRVPFDIPDSLGGLRR
jgi:hypothetical protein